MIGKCRQYRIRPQTHMRAEKKQAAHERQGFDTNDIFK